MHNCVFSVSYGLSRYIKYKQTEARKPLAPMLVLLTTEGVQQLSETKIDSSSVFPFTFFYNRNKTMCKGRSYSVIN